MSYHNIISHIEVKYNIIYYLADGDLRSYTMDGDPQRINSIQKMLSISAATIHRIRWSICTFAT